MRCKECNANLRDTKGVCCPACGCRMIMSDVAIKSNSKREQMKKYTGNEKVYHQYINADEHGVVKRFDFTQPVRATKKKKIRYTPEELRLDNPLGILHCIIEGKFTYEEGIKIYKHNVTN